MSFRERLNGVFPPCVTVFDDNEEVAYEKIRDNIDRYTAAGVRGYMPLGTNGEFRSLTDEESVKVIDVYATTRAPGRTILAGCGRESEKATVAFIHKAADHGVDFASVLAPHYFADRMTDDVLIDYYKSVADASPIPIVLYNIPKYASGVVFTENVIAGVARHENIAGMKDTSTEEISRYTGAVPEGVDFWVLAGTIKKFYVGLEAGAIGGVLSIAAYLPEKCVELQEIWNGGEKERGAKYDAWIRELSSRAAGKHGVAGVKAAMDLLGYDGGKPRRPLPGLTDTEIAETRAVLRAEGLLP